jgi:hypothetical protein
LGPTGDADGATHCAAGRDDGPQPATAAANPTPITARRGRVTATILTSHVDDVKHPDLDLVW